MLCREAPPGPGVRAAPPGRERGAGVGAGKGMRVLDEGSTTPPSPSSAPRQLERGHGAKRHPIGGK